MASPTRENNNRRMFGQDLNTLTEQADRLPQVSKADVRPGDWVLVTN